MRCQTNNIALHVKTKNAERSMVVSFLTFINYLYNYLSLCILYNNNNNNVINVYTNIINVYGSGYVPEKDCPTVSYRFLSTV